MQGKEELMKELEVLDELANANPCNLTDDGFKTIASGLRILIGKYCERGMSLEKVAIYFGVTTKTIVRWEHDEELGFPKPKRDGHRDMSFQTDMIVRWAKEHPDKMKKNK